MKLCPTCVSDQCWPTEVSLRQQPAGSLARLTRRAPRRRLLRFPRPKILLAGDQIAVADGKALPQAGLDKIGAERLQLVLDAPGHDMPVSGHQVHRPDGVVGKILLDIGKAGDGLALDEMVAVAQPRITQHRRAVAQRGRDLARLVERDELLLEPDGLFEGEHRRLAAGHDDGVEVCDIKRRNRPGAFHQGSEPGRRQKPHRDEIRSRNSPMVARIAHGIGLAFAAIRREYVDAIPFSVNSR